MSANDRQVDGNHYKGAIQVWDFVHSNDIGYLAGNVIKYVARYKKKGGMNDLLKANHYLDKLIEEEVKVEIVGDAGSEYVNQD